MAERVTAGELLRLAAARYDAPGGRLAWAAWTAWRGDFVAGGRWMRLALAELRGVPLPETKCSFRLLGFVKYGLACAAALPAAVAAFAWDLPPLLLLSVPAFYAAEAQMVFLFPLALDGSARPFRDGRKWAVRAGGTWAVMRVVMPLALTMLLGGFVGRGFLRSWCLGCLAVCVWYERVRNEPLAA